MSRVLHYTFTEAKRICVGGTCSLSSQMWLQASCNIWLKQAGQSLPRPGQKLVSGGQREDIHSLIPLQTRGISRSATGGLRNRSLRRQAMRPASRLCNCATTMTMRSSKEASKCKQGSQSQRVGARRLVAMLRRARAVSTRRPG